MAGHYVIVAAPVAPAGRWGDTAGVSQKEYLLANQPSELERLQLQARVWEPTGRQLLSKIGSGSGARALDVGCGALGWLRILGEWVGASGQVVGADIDESLLGAARSFLEAEGISNVELVVDDLFDSKLEPHSFDLVHLLGGVQAVRRQRAVPVSGRSEATKWSRGTPNNSRSARRRPGAWCIPRPRDRRSAHGGCRGRHRLVVGARQERLGRP